MSLRHHPTRRRPHWVILSSEISERTDYELRRENGGSGRRLERGGGSDRTAAQGFRGRTGDTHDKRHGRGQTDRCSRKTTRLITGQRAPIEGHADGTGDGPYEQRNYDQSATPRHHRDRTTHAALEAVQGDRQPPTSHRRASAKPPVRCGSRAAPRRGSPPASGGAVRSRSCGVGDGSERDPRTGTPHRPTSCATATQSTVTPSGNV